MKAKLKKEIRQGLIERLKLFQYRLNTYAISTPLKDEIRAIIESFEEIEAYR